MLKIHDAVHEVVSSNLYLEFGLLNKILNLSQTATLIKPIVEARLKKSAKKTAIVTSLSRIQKRYKHYKKIEDFELSQMSIQSNLCTITFWKTPNLIQKLGELHSKLFNEKSFFIISESTKEITIFFEKKNLEVIKEKIKDKARYENLEIAAIMVSFDEKYFEIPGLILNLIQIITLQNINLVEISSTFTELIFFMHKKDISLGIETINTAFKLA